MTAAAEDPTQVPVEEAPLLRIAVVVARDGRHPERLPVALRSIDGQLPKPAGGSPTSGVPHHLAATGAAAGQRLTVSVDP